MNQQNKIYYHPHGNPIPQFINTPQVINYGYQQPHGLDNHPYVYNTVQQGQSIYYEQRSGLNGQKVVIDQGGVQNIPKMHGQQVVIDQGGVQNIPNQQSYVEKNQRHVVQGGQNLQNFYPVQNLQTGGQNFQNFQTIQNLQTTQPIIVEKVQKKQFIVEQPFITREVYYQNNVQPFVFQQHIESLPGSPSKLRRSRSLTMAENENLMYRSQVIEGIKRSTLENSNIVQIPDKSGILDEQILALDKQNATFRQELEKYHKENHELNNKVKKLEFIIQDYEQRIRSSAEGQNQVYIQEIEKYTAIVSTFESQFSLFTQEIEKFKSQNSLLTQERERLTGSLRKKDEEISILHQELRRKDEEISILHKESRQKEDFKADFDKISGFLSSKIRETEDCKSKLSEKDAIFSEIENKMQILMDEVERLNSLLKKKVEEVNFLNIKITETQSYSRESFEKNEILSRERDRLTLIIRENNKELETWRSQYSGFSGITLKVQDLLLTVVLLSSEVESLRMRIAGSEKQVEELRRSQVLKSLEGV